MRIERVAVSVVAALLCAIPGVAAMAATGQSVGAALPTSVPSGVNAAVLSAQPTGPVVLSGTLKDASGHRTAGRVAALAWPSQKFLLGLPKGQGFTEPTVGGSTAGADGRFSLQINPSLLPVGYVASSGQVNLNVVGWTGQSAGTWSTSVWLTKSSGSRAATVIGATGSKPDIVVALKQPLTASNSTALTSARPYGGGGCYSYWVDIGNTKYPTEQMGETLPYPYWPVPAQFVITSSESKSLGVASSYSGGYGSWSAGGTSSINSSVSHAFAWSTADQAYYTQDRYDEYRDYNHWCETWMPQYYYWDMYNLGNSWTGGESYPWWGYYAYESPQVFTRGGGWAFNLSAGIGMGPYIGLNLSVTESYSSNFTESYDFTNGGDPYMCGSNNYPGIATRIEQC